MSRLSRPLMLAGLGACLATAMSCDGNMEPVEAADAGAGDLGSYNNVRGYCSSMPQTCDDLIPGDDETELACCFGNFKCWCKSGELLFVECGWGCLYNTAEEEVVCKPATGGEPQGPGGTTEPPTDPGPGF